MRPTFIGPYYVPYEAHDTIREVQVAVARHYRVPLADILGPEQATEYVRPRHVAMYLACRRTGKNSRQIGDRFRRDRTSIIYADKKIGALRKVDPALDAEIRKLEGRL